MPNAASGPDWTDIGLYLRELEKLHDCASMVSIQPGGLASDSTVRLTVLLTSAFASVGMRPKCVAVTQTWPNPNWRHLEACLFNMLHIIDFKATEGLWEQLNLTDT